ncbi:uncharacterized protein [Aquarana catesbeiana]|uniref:uncharacterized protein n=1 Tax=Aquarana catesbeiana TaxID=8400 RepID=UPI003CCA189A
MRGLLIVLLGAVSAAVASPPQVICTSSNPAELSGNVTLTCQFRANLEVLQVTWQKKRGKDTQDMVTYSEEFGTHVIDPFKKHITVLKATLAESCISITKLEKEDEACYNCLFHTYLHGPFTGEVCLTNLKSANEVLCSGQGNDLRINLNPREIQTRTSVQLVEKKIGDVSTVKGQYSDPSINPTCEFWLEKESGEVYRLQVVVWSSHGPEGGISVIYSSLVSTASKEAFRIAWESDFQFQRDLENWQTAYFKSFNENQNPAEDAGMFSIQCSASGHKKFMITWSNEGQPVSQEDKVNTAGNTTMVTSTLNHTVSSLPADHRIICTITLSVPPEECPEKPALSGKEPTLENFNKGDAENKAQQQRAWERYLMIASAGFPFLVILIFILFYYKVWKRKEAKTPRKQAGNGPEAPTSSIKKLVRVIKGWDSPKFSTENDSGPAIQPSPINKGKPSNSDQSNPRETLESSVKKRNLRGSKKSTSAIKKLEFNEHLCK